ncbi:hypothetical protein [Neptunitalea lumnitzerae]|uniref:GOLD domain-containing protein n=1 Tax=Neptunitalea lumnitzerae TaxID=2965509 RepID=A0ABQ5MFB6_9FLAO|nr:hypothetical protein [Neptunitalea sp. Y10]GLB48092.1 hypothetical protein Y10_04600 [Neptunitalea sp. Y10]
MKKFLVLFVAALLTFSCSLDDDDTVDYHFEFIGADYVEFPAEDMHVNSSYPVTLYYTLPNTCYYINGIDYNYTSDFERVVSLVATVYNNNNCEPTDGSTLNDSFTFRPLYAGTYTFNFISGIDESTGEYTYLTYEVEVLE